VGILKKEGRGKRKGDPGQKKSKGKRKNGKTKMQKSLKRGAVNPIQRLGEKTRKEKKGNNIIISRNLFLNEYDGEILVSKNFGKYVNMARKCSKRQKRGTTSQNVRV